MLFSRALIAIVCSALAVQATTLRASSTDTDSELETIFAGERSLAAACPTEGVAVPALETLTCPSGTFFSTCDACPVVQFSPASLYGETVIDGYKIGCHLAVDMVTSGGKTFAMKPQGHKPVFELLSFDDGIPNNVKSQEGYCHSGGGGTRVTEVLPDGSVSASCEVKLFKNGQAPTKADCTLTSVIYPAVPQAICNDEASFGVTDGYVKNSHKPKFVIPDSAIPDIVKGDIEKGCAVQTGCQCFDKVSYSGGSDHSAIFFNPACNDCTSAACGPLSLNNKCGPYDTVTLTGDGCTAPLEMKGVQGNKDIGITCTVDISASVASDKPTFRVTATF